MEPSNSNIKKFLMFQEMEAPEKFLIFPLKKTCLIFRKTEAPQKFLIFQKRELSYISGNRNPPKILYIPYIPCNSFHLFYKLNQTMLLVYKKN